MGTIVVVDGGDAVCGTLAASLLSSGHEIVGGPTPQAALAGTWTDPTVVFIRLPRDSSQLTQACRQLKRDPRLERVPLIACGDDVSEAEQAFAGGADDFCRFSGDAREFELRAASAEARPAAWAPRHQTILVVDDDLFFRRSLADLLRRDGYRVVEAETGAEALEALELHSPSLAVVDLFMPNLGGVELVQHLRAMPRWQRLPVVAVSGVRAASEPGLIATLDRLAVHDFIEKQGPALDSLSVVVDELLRSDPTRFRGPRVSSHLMGEFRPTAEAPWLSMFVSDLGTGGAFVRTLVLPKAETMIHVRLDWGDRRPPFLCMARVAWTRSRSASGGLVGMGVEFAQLGDEDRERLRSHVYS